MSNFRTLDRSCATKWTVPGLIGVFSLLLFSVSAARGQTSTNTPPPNQLFSFAVPMYVVNEGEGGIFDLSQAPSYLGAAITINRFGDLRGASSVDLVVTNRTATNSVHFMTPVGGRGTVVTNTITFAPFQESTNFLITILDDLGETNTAREAGLLLKNPRPAPGEDPMMVIPGISPAPGDTASLRILDDDEGFNFERIRVRVNESVGDVVLGVTLKIGGTNGISVDYVITDQNFQPLPGSGVATNGVDYTGATGTLTFGPDVTRQTITIPITDDSLVEFNEDFFVYLTNAQGEISITNITTVTNSDDTVTNIETVVTQPYAPLGQSWFSWVTINGGMQTNEQPAGASSLRYFPPSALNRTPGANNVVYSIDLLADGRAIIGGDFTAVNAVPRNRLALVTTNGLVDPSFNPGRGPDGFVNVVAVHKTGPQLGKIVVAGGFSAYNGVQRNSIARLHPDGSLDSSFNPGTGADGPIYAVHLEADGSMIIGGEFSTFNGVDRRRLARLNSSGQLVSTFDPGTGPDATVYAIATEQDPVFSVGAANFGFGPAENRTNITTGATSGQIEITYDFSIVPDTLHVYYQGVLIFDTGLTNNEVVVTNVDGTISTNLQPRTVTVNYGPGTSEDVEIVINEGSGDPGTVWDYSAVVRPNVELGVLVGGDFTAFNGVPQDHFARLRTDGSLDPNYNSGAGADGTVYTIAIQPDGKALLGGAFTSVQGLLRRSLARINYGGEVDPTFATGAGADDVVYSIALQPDGRIVIGGAFEIYNFTRRSGVARVLPDGSLDTTFMDTAHNAYAGIVGGGGFIDALAILPDGNILIGGLFRQLGGGDNRTATMVRYNLAELVGGETPGPGNVGFAAPEFTADEHAGSAAVVVTRSNGLLGDILARIGTVGGLAIAGEDYTATNYSLIFPDGGLTNALFEFPILDDAVPEGDETVELGVFGFVGFVDLGGELVATGPGLTLLSSALTIIDNDFSSGVLSFTEPVFYVSENGTNAVITVTRTNGISGLVSVDYRAVADTASASDFTARSGTLSFAPGQTMRSFTIPVLDDSQVENDEKVTLTLVNPRGGATIGLGSSALVIIDNDFAPGRVSFVATNYVVKEDGGQVLLSVQRTGGNVGVLTVNYTTFEGTASVPFDFTEVFGTLRWDSGDTSIRTVSVPVNNDGLVEAIERFTVQLSDANPVDALGLTTTATVEINDDDAFGLLSFNSADYLADENGGSAIIVVTRRQGSAEFVSVDYSTTRAGTAVPGVDYQEVSGRLNFGIGETSKSFLVPLIDDGVLDGSKTVVIALTNAVKAALGPITNATLTILDRNSLNIPAGSIDTEFRVGEGFDRTVYAIALQSDGKLLVGGDFSRYNDTGRDRLARLNTNGTLDRTFVVSTETNSSVRALLIQSDGRIIVAGTFTNLNGATLNRVGRLSVNGALDGTFNPGAAADSAVFALAEMFNGPDRKILVGGSFNTFNGQTRRNLVRLNNDGSIDQSFRLGIGPNGPVLAIAPLRDGKVVIAGEFSIVNGEPRNNIARLNADGSLDASFDPGFGTDGPIRAVLLQNDDKLVIGGLFTSASGTLQNRIARLNANGSLDSSFLPGNGANGPVFALGQQIDGRILVGGDFSSFDGVTRNGITRLNENGSVDTTINFGLGANGFVSAIAVQPTDRKVVLGGAFTSYDGTARNRIVRIYGGSLSGPGSLEFGMAEFMANENATNAFVTVRRSGGTSGGVSVDYSSRSITAQAGVDYQDVTGRLQFAPGETIQTLVIPVLDDVLPEDDETLELVLSNPSGVTNVALGRQPVTIVRIISDDSILDFSQPGYSVNENVVGQRALITVRRTGESLQTLRVSYSATAGTATAGSDFTPVSGSLSFGPNERFKTFLVPIIDDVAVEANESITLRLTNPSGATIGLGTATLTINDNDFAPGILSFEGSVVVSEASQAATLLIQRVSGSAGVVSLDYQSVALTATEGQDFIGSRGTITFADGETRKAITVPVIDDAIVEGTEFFAVTISNPTGGAQLGGATTVDVTIVDDDFGPGSLDEEFDPGFIDGAVATLALQRDGKVLLGGDFQTVGSFARPGIARVLTTGAPDATFIASLRDFVPVTDVEIEAGGRIWIGRTASTVSAAESVLLLTTNGFVDATFDAVPLSPVFSVAGQTAEGKVLVGGGFSSPAQGIARLNRNGTVDISFDPDGGTDGQVDTVLLQADGKVLIAGSFSTVGGTPRRNLARLHPTGLLDSTFLTNSVSPGTDGAIYDVLLQPDGKILISGAFRFVNGVSRSGIARLNPNGSVDPSFIPGNGPQGGNIFAIAFQNDGKIVIGGSFTSVSGAVRNRVARLDSSGSLDLSFDAGSGPDGDVNDVLVQADGKVIIGGDFITVNGFFRPGLARLNGDLDQEPVEIRIDEVTVQSGRMTLLFTSEPGRSYTIEVSDDLSRWTPLGTVVAATDSHEFTDPEPASQSRRFYRIRFGTL